jgi:hypothetical protein
MYKTVGLILPVMVLLSACTQSPTGVWRGSMNSAVSNQNASALGIVTGDKQTYLRNQSTGIVFIGPLSVSINKGDGTLPRYLPTYSSVSINGSDGYVQGTVSSTASISSTIVAKVSMNGSYSSSDDNGTFALSYDASTYERSGSLSLASGNWTFADASGFTLTIALDSSGNWTGSDTTGCISSGSLALIDSSRNLYSATATESSCGQYDGTYTGVATLSDRLTSNDTLTVFLYNDNAVFAFDLTRS